MTKFLTNFNDNSAFLEILGDESDMNEYTVDFIDLDTNYVEYSSILRVNHWSKLNDIDDKNISIKVTSNNVVVFDRNKNNKFNSVYILFGSDSIGDTVAWIPYVDEYRKINNVKVIVHTSHNKLFDKVYPDVIFTDISNSDYITDVDKKFKIDYGPELYILNGVLSPDSWYIENKKYNNCVGYFDYRTKSLQSIAPMILGLPDEEVVPKINIPENSAPKIKGKYVVVAMQSTAQLKYWNNPFGWERVFDFLGRNGYKVVLIDKNKNFGVQGSYNQAPKSKYVIDKTGNYLLEDRIVDMKYADMMITISSGLAWVCWGVGTPVVMISGFTKPFNEFKRNNFRVFNSSVCNGCWHDSNITYNPFDWKFCPKNNDYVCSKAIQPKDVTDAIKKVIEIKKLTD
jgi:autotransporter strand-loop-strand O-heptosyltransferase